MKYKAQSTLCELRAENGEIIQKKSQAGDYLIAVRGCVYLYSCCPRTGLTPVHLCGCLVQNPKTSINISKCISIHTCSPLT